MKCAYCKYNDGAVYTSNPPKYRCSVTGEYHLALDDCNVEFAPVKHGRWFPCTKTGMPLTEFGRRQGEKWFGYKCSKCNTIYKGNALTESPYCQRCGTRMDLTE